MSNIDHIIPSSSLEAIRAAIFRVLHGEAVNQAYEFGSALFDGVTFWKERTVPIDKTESAIIVINTFKGKYDNISVGSQHGHYTFVLDFMANAKTVPGIPGSEGAAYRIEKLMMASRYILMSPNYLTLGLTGFVEATSVTGFQMSKDERVGDASNNAIGQILFDVWCEEKSKPNAGILLAMSTTDVLVNNTDKGYQYQAP